MSLAQLRYPPAGEAGWQEFCWWHYNHHLAIISAARQVKNVNLTLYQIWPFSPSNTEGWLLQHQSQHTDMDLLYGINGADLSTLDFTNKREVDAWIYLQWIEHAGVAAVCGLPI